MQSQVIGQQVRPAGVPLLRILAAFPLSCFCGALVTDAAYAASADMIWADFSAWLLAVGMVTGVLAALIGVIDVARHWRAWPARPVLAVALGSLMALVLGLFDNLVHSRDAWTSVVPAGLALSAATVAVAVATAWIAAAAAGRVPAMRYYERERR